MKKLFAFAIFAGLSYFGNSQFHTVKIPMASQLVQETQVLGITDITITYSSPAIRGRNVWENGVIPFDGNPIPWRAGANMNTKISFSTDVSVSGEPLKAGSYGFHIIPRKQGQWSVLFVGNDNHWGSYYIDIDKDVVLSVPVSPIETHFSEQLDFEFVDRKEDELTIALEWGIKRIPLVISVDLNKTVIDNFRYELSGINTYQWEAWNDAANWCLQRNTNLEEALQWANRSIEGGYKGFAGNKNFRNLTTKANILKALNRNDEAEMVLQEIETLND